MTKVEAIYHLNRSLKLLGIEATIELIERSQDEEHKVLYLGILKARGAIK